MEQGGIWFEDIVTNIAVSIEYFTKAKSQTPKAKCQQPNSKRQTPTPNTQLLKANTQ